MLEGDGNSLHMKIRMLMFKRSVICLMCAHKDTDIWKCSLVCVYSFVFAELND